MEGLLGVAVTSAIGIGTRVLGGWLADTYGPYRMFFLFTAISALISYPFFAYVLAAPSFTRLFIAQFVVLTVFGLLQGSGPGLLAGLFPVAVRSTGMAISYNVGVTVFGGFAPLTVTWLIAMTGSKLVPAFDIIGAAVLDRGGGQHARWRAAARCSRSSLNAIWKRSSQCPARFFFRATGCCRDARWRRDGTCTGFGTGHDRIPHREHRGRTACGARARRQARPRGDGFRKPRWACRRRPCLIGSTRTPRPRAHRRNSCRRLRAGHTGVVATLKGAAPADDRAAGRHDALPIMENDTPGASAGARRLVSSRPGVMHACAWRRAHGDRACGGRGAGGGKATNCAGTVKFIFQPGEEGGRGALPMVNAGVVDDVDYFIAIHLGTGVPSRTFRPAVRGHLASAKLDVTFRGRAAHAGGRPEEGRNALLAASSAVVGLYGISVIMPAARA